MKTLLEPGPHPAKQLHVTLDLGPDGVRLNLLGSRMGALWALLQPFAEHGAWLQRAEAAAAAERPPPASDADLRWYAAVFGREMSPQDAERVRGIEAAASLEQLLTARDAARAWGELPGSMAAADAARALTELRAVVATVSIARARVNVDCVLALELAGAELSYSPTAIAVAVDSVAVRDLASDTLLVSAPARGRSVDVRLAADLSDIAVSLSGVRVVARLEPVLAAVEALQAMLPPSSPAAPPDTKTPETTKTPFKSKIDLTVDALRVWLPHGRQPNAVALTLSTAGCVRLDGAAIDVALDVSHAAVAPMLAPTSLRLACQLDPGRVTALAVALLDDVAVQLTRHGLGSLLGAVDELLQPLQSRAAAPATPTKPKPKPEQKSKSNDHLVRAFAAADADGNGVLTVDEVSALLLGEQPDLRLTLAEREEFVRAFIARCDADHDGTISLAEFSAALALDSLAPPHRGKLPLLCGEYAATSVLRPLRETLDADREAGEALLRELLETEAYVGDPAALQKKLVRITRNYDFAEELWATSPALGGPGGRPWLLTPLCESDNVFDADARIAPLRGATTAAAAAAAPAALRLELEARAVRVSVLDDVLPRCKPRLELLVDELSGAYDSESGGRLALRLHGSVYNSAVQAPEPVIERWEVRGDCGPGPRVALRAGYLAVNVTAPLLESAAAVADILSAPASDAGPGVLLENRTGVAVTVSSPGGATVVVRPNARVAYEFQGDELFELAVLLDGTDTPVRVRPDDPAQSGPLAVRRAGRQLTLSGRLALRNAGAEPLTVSAGAAEPGAGTVLTLQAAGGVGYAPLLLAGAPLRVWHPRRRVWSAPVDLVDGARVGHCVCRAVSPYFELEPATLLRNALPFALEVEAVAVPLPPAPRTLGGTPQRGKQLALAAREAGLALSDSDEVQRGSVVADGGRLALYDDQDDHAVFARARLPQLGWTEPFCVSGGADMPMVVEAAVELAAPPDAVPAPTLTFLPESGTLFCPVWLRNRSDLRLRYRGSDTDEVADDLAGPVVLLSRRCAKVSVKPYGLAASSASGYFRREQADWSAPFPLAGTTGELTAGGAVLGVTLRSRPLPLHEGDRSITVVDFAPRFVVQNRLPRPVALRPLLGRPPAAERATAPVVTLDADGGACAVYSFTGRKGDRVAALWPSSQQLREMHALALASSFSDDEDDSSSADDGDDAGRAESSDDDEDTDPDEDVSNTYSDAPPSPPRRRRRMSSSEGAEKLQGPSARVLVDRVGETFAWLSDGSLVRASIEVNGATLLVVLSDAAHTPPYRIENRSAMAGLWVRQANTHRARRTRVPAASWADFAWTVDKGAAQVVEVGLLGASQPFGKFSLDEVRHLGAQRVSAAGVQLALSVEVRDGRTRALVARDFPSTLLQRAPAAPSLLRRADVQLLLDGLGLALVDDGRRELLNVTVDEVRVQSEPDSSAVALSVLHAQVDDMTPFAKYPVVLQPRDAGLFTCRRRPEPAARVPLLQARVEVSASSLALALDSCEVLLQPLQVAVDVDYVLRVVDAVWRLFPAAAEAADGPEPEPEAPDPDAVQPDAHGSLYVKLLHLHAVEVDVELVLPHRRPHGGGALPGPLRVLAAVGTSLAHVSPEFRFRELIVQHAFRPAGALAAQLAGNYARQAVPQLYKVLGSVEILGDPVGLVDQIGTGVVEFFRVTSAELTGASDTKGEGVRLLLTSVVGGAFGSVSKVTGSVNSLVKGITGTEGSQWHDADADDPDHVGEGIVQGGEVLARSLADGISGLWSKPLEGAQRGGAAGFAEGFVRGVVGAAAAPVVGVLGATTKLAQSVEATAHIFDPQLDDRQRRRWPRPFLLGPRLRALAETPIVTGLAVRARAARGLPRPRRAATGSPTRTAQLAPYLCLRFAGGDDDDEEARTGVARLADSSSPAAAFAFPDGEPAAAFDVSADECVAHAPLELVLRHKEALWRDAELGRATLHLDELCERFGVEGSVQWVSLGGSSGSSGSSAASGDSGDSAELELEVEPVYIMLGDALRNAVVSGSGSGSS